ncbi:MAG: DUF2334 domain-containing protein [Methanofollis liminatans]|nr:DUF2334 domain-containing protein [Methanofollis liminatans]
MMDDRRRFYGGVFLAGFIIAVAGIAPGFAGTFPHLDLRGIVVLLLVPGTILFALGFLLIVARKRSLGQGPAGLRKVEAVILILLVVSLAGMLALTSYALIHQTALLHTKWSEDLETGYLMMTSMDQDNPFYAKKVIIRDDDIGADTSLSSLRWIADLAEEKDISITLSIIPAHLSDNPATVDFLNTLDRNRVEFATHGYAHEAFFPLPYDEQYRLIECSTAIMTEVLDCRPVSFVPPQGSGNADTSRAARMLGYTTITDMIGYPCYLTNFISSFEYETGYTMVSHRSFEEFTRSFEEFEASSEEYYLLYLHDWTFLNDDGTLNTTRTEQFEGVIDYLGDKGVAFMTLGEASAWHLDGPAIRTGQIDETTYYVDLQACRYNHTLTFRSDRADDGAVVVTDLSPGETEVRCAVEKIGPLYRFYGERGHLYSVRY